MSNTDLAARGREGNEDDRKFGDNRPWPELSSSPAPPSSRPVYLHNIEYKAKASYEGMGICLQLFWTKIPMDEVPSTIWQEISSCSSTANVPLDTEELERMFSNKPKSGRDM
ncbi:hypothetical protein BC936DRAFT_149017 [Jimgerdemannia flammicorona]|uniref:FH2 domain-containing protein n=1 Tax=Jimgerdemannia flammicorona TaxID=994334 RepID=A0A433D1R8_9FUNG|nr:hypothetical protein BC936DRAFT_149017 [Jimgerdemannia flammicorona]